MKTMIISQLVVIIVVVAIVAIVSVVYLASRKADNAVQAKKENESIVNTPAPIEAPAPAPTSRIVKDDKGNLYQLVSETNNGVEFNNLTLIEPELTPEQKAVLNAHKQQQAMEAALADLAAREAQRKINEERETEAEKQARLYAREEAKKNAEVADLVQRMRDLKRKEKVEPVVTEVTRVANEHFDAKEAARRDQEKAELYAEIGKKLSPPENDDVPFDIPSEEK